MRPLQRVRALWLLSSLSILSACNSSNSGSGRVAAPQDTTVPTDVTNFSAQAGLKSATLTWDAATDDQEIAGYRIVLVSPAMPPGSLTATTRIVGPTPTSVEWTGLQGGVAYSFSIIAIDSSNNVSRNAAFTAVTPQVPDVTPPDAITGLTGIGGRNADGVVQIHLTWTASASPDVVRYFLCLGTSTGSCDILLDVDIGNVTQITIPDDSGPVTAADLPEPLEIDREYFVRVIAVDASGNQSIGVTTMVTPTLSSDNTPPAPVEILDVIPGSNSVTLVWQPQDTEATQYAVYYRDFGNDAGRETVPWTLFTTTTSTTATVEGLTNGVTYEFMVAGIDNAGNETPGAETAVTADDEATKTTAIPTSNLIEATPNVPGGVFREESFDAPRDVVITVSTTVDGLLTGDAGTVFYYTLDGSVIDTTAPANNETTGFLTFADARVTEVVPERLYTIRIDFDPSVAGVQTISENTLRPNGGADHIVLRYLVRTTGDASRLFEEDYLIYSGRAVNSFFKFSGMRTVRGFPTLTALLDGATRGDLILIGGSTGAFDRLLSRDSASRYRVQFEHFEALQPTARRDTMTATRVHHRASLLAADNESILVSGGFNLVGRLAPADGAANASLALGTTDVFRGDTFDEGFEVAPQAMDSARSFHTSTRLYDGRILLLGGLNGQINLRGSVANPEVVVPTPGRNEPVNTVLTFDPDTQGLPVADLVGGVLEKLAGGVVTEVGVVVNSAPNRLDPTVQDLTLEGIASDNIPGETFRVINGPVVTGELFANDGTNGAALGDTMAVARYGHTATLLSDGSVFICGGTFDYDSATTDRRSDGLNEFLCEIYDPQVDEFVSLGDAAELPDTRYFHSATLLRDGKVLICGGLERGDYMYRTTAFAGGAALRRSAYLFDPFNRTITRVGDMVTPRFFHAAALLPNGEVLIAGGYTAVDEIGRLTITKSAEIYDPDTRTFRATTGKMITYRGPCAAAVIPNVGNTKIGGQVLVAGGSENTLAEVFNPSTGRFSATAHSMTSDRTVGAEHSTLLDGRVLITGGQEATIFDHPGDFLDTVEIYNTSLVKFIGSKVRMGRARRHHRSTVLADGRVLITGGENTTGGLAHCEIYNPADDSFEEVARMLKERYRHTATLLPDGRVFVCGGANVIGPLASCEIFDPATGAFDSAPSMNVGRFNHTATLLPNGWVLITGGESIDDTSVEIFDPIANDFLAAPAVDAMLFGRDGHSATRPSYTIGRARFTNGSAIVTGSDAGANAFGYDSTNWLTQGVQPGDIIVSSSQNQPYVITGVGEFSLTLGNHPDFDHDDAGYSGPSTIDNLTDGAGADGFEYYIIHSQDVYIAGGEVTTPDTEVFDFDPNANEWPLTDPTDSIFAAGQSSGEGRFGQELTPLADWRLLLVGSRNPINGRYTTLGGTPSDFADDPWTSADLDPAGEPVAFPMSFRVRNHGIVIVNEHSARAFFPE